MVTTAAIFMIFSDTGQLNPRTKEFLITTLKDTFKNLHGNN